MRKRLAGQTERKYLVSVTAGHKVHDAAPRLGFDFADAVSIGPAHDQAVVFLRQV